MIPLSLLPESVRWIAGILPTSYAMQAYNGLAFNQPTVFDPWVSVMVLLAGAILAFGLAIFLFNWDSRNNTRRGHPLMALLVLLPYLAGIFLA
jgi:ABC-type multidrug transport system permease subunit